MKAMILLPLLLLSLSLQANEDINAEDRLISQLIMGTQLDENGSTLRDADSTRSQSEEESIEVSEEACAKIQVEREKLRNYEIGSPEFLAIVLEAIKWEEICYVYASINQDNDVVGFAFTNKTQNEINPATAPYGSKRRYKFEFEERSKQNINLKITEDAGLTGKMSRDLLESTIIFIPRVVIPYIELHPDLEHQKRVYLPTNERVTFDSQTNEIIEGVIIEEAMDMNENRHERQFAHIEYVGKGIMIRADRRGGTPEYIYAQSFNINERIAEATITHKDKVCYVSKNLIWENANYRPNKAPYFKYSTDQAFLDEVINPICGWNLTLADISMDAASPAVENLEVQETEVEEIISEDVGSDVESTEELDEVTDENDTDAATTVFY